MSKTKKKPVKPSYDPSPINGDTWYYETRRGIQVIHWVEKFDAPRKALTIKIPMRLLAATVRRCAAKKKAKLTK